MITSNYKNYENTMNDILLAFQQNSVLLGVDRESIFETIGDLANVEIPSPAICFYAEFLDATSPVHNEVVNCYIHVDIFCSDVKSSLAVRKCFNIVYNVIQVMNNEFSYKPKPQSINIDTIAEGLGHVTISFETKIILR